MTARMSDQPLDAPEAPGVPQTQTALLERTLPVIVVSALIDVTAPDAADAAA